MSSTDGSIDVLEALTCLLASVLSFNWCEKRLYCHFGEIQAYGGYLQLPLSNIP